MLFDPSGRRLRRSMGFLPEYHVERDPPAGVDSAEALELVDAIASDEIELDEESLEFCQQP